MNQLREDSKNTKIEYEKKLEALNKTLREREAAMANANNTIKQQKVKAEIALNELKKEIEAKSVKLYDEMKEQMSKCEADLERSKALRDKHAREFAKQTDDLKSEHKREIERLEKERLTLKHEFENEKQKLTKHHESSYDQFHAQMQQQITENNLQCKAKVDELSKVKSVLEMKIVQLEQELIEANALRKQQICELGILREDEKSRINRSFEKELDAYRDKHEQEIKFMRAKLREQKEELESEIRCLIKQSDERCRKCAEKLAELEHNARYMDAENKRLRESLDKEKQDKCSRFEDEKSSLRKFFQSQVNVRELGFSMDQFQPPQVREKLISSCIIKIRCARFRASITCQDLYDFFWFLRG